MAAFYELNKQFEYLCSKALCITSNLQKVFRFWLLGKSENAGTLHKIWYFNLPFKAKNSNIIKTRAKLLINIFITKFPPVAPVPFEKNSIIDKIWIYFYLYLMVVLRLNLLAGNKAQSKHKLCIFLYIVLCVYFLLSRKFELFP